MRGLCRNLESASRTTYIKQDMAVNFTFTVATTPTYSLPCPRHVHGCDQRYPASRGGGGAITHVDGHQGVGARAACLDPFWLIHSG